MNRTEYEKAREELRTAQRVARNALDKLEARWIESGGVGEMIGKYYRIGDSDFIEYIHVTEYGGPSHVRARGWGFELSYQDGTLIYASFDGIKHLYANQSFGDEITEEEFWTAWDESIANLIGRVKGEKSEQAN